MMRLVGGLVVSVCAVVGLVSPAMAVITVTGEEIWDGINVPHAAQGVTFLDGVYSIPDELLIGSNSKIRLSAGTPSSSITFQFTGSGGLKFTDSTSIIDTYVGGRFVPAATFTLNMNNNPISVVNPGAGRIVNGKAVLEASTGDTMAIAINSNADVTLGEIDVTRNDSRSVGINVTAGGNLNIGRLANPDTNSGGDNVFDINVTAKSITLGNIDTYASRPDNIRRNGDINLTALAPPSFDPANYAGNSVAQNFISLNGVVNSNGPPTNNAAGSLNLKAPKVVLGSSFVANLSENADFNVTAGNITGAFPQSAVFQNASAVTPDSLIFTVYHDNEATASMSWKNNASGTWHSTSNWSSPAIPLADVQTAVFGSVITSPRTIFLDQAAKVKGLQFDTDSKVALAGASTLTLDANAGNTSIQVLRGAHEIQVPVMLQDNADITTTTNASRRVALNGGVNLNGKTLTVAGPGAVNINNNVTGGGTITNNGILGTGGSTNLDGNLTSTGTLLVNLAGAAANTYDAWNITGNATLSGVLSVDALSGFAPSGGQTFTVLTAANVNAGALTLGGPDAALFTLIKSATSLVLQAVGGSVPGDYNGNGIVDAADYTVWRNQLNTNVPNGTGADGDGNGVVNQLDYTYWKTRFGNTSGSGALLGNTASVPEPGSAGLTLVAALASVFVAGRRKKVERAHESSCPSLTQSGVPSSSNRRFSRLLVTLAVCLSCLASSRWARAVITVSGEEVWDGISIPHADQGVTFSNGIYTIPDQLLISSGSIIYLQQPFTSNVTSNITFKFTGSGGLTFTDETSIIDVFKGGRYVPAATFTLDMGNNPIGVLNPNAGRIINGITVTDGGTGDPMGVSILSNSNVTLGEIDLTRKDSLHSGINITAGGFVDIGRLANPDINNGGDLVDDINISASSITLGDIDTRAFRPDGIRRNGDINLKALAPPSFDPVNAAGNTVANNVITLKGFVNTNSAATTNAGGSLNLTAAKVVLESTFTADISENADFNVTTGSISGGFTAGQLFANSSSVTPDTLNYTVYHDNELPLTITWKANASGAWHNANNWNPTAIPQLTQQTAVFGAAITSPRTVYLEQAATAKALQFDTPATVSVGGTAGLTLDADSGNSSISIVRGAHKIDVAVTLNDNLDITTMTAASRQISFNGAVNLNGKTVTITGPGVVNFNNLLTGGGSIVNAGGGLGASGLTGLEGDLTSSGLLAIDIDSATSYDSWDVAGSASISGLLSVDLAEGYRPKYGQTFTVLSADSLDATSLALAGPDAGLFNLFTSGNSLVLQAVPEPSSALILLVGLIGFGATRFKRVG